MCEYMLVSVCVSLYICVCVCLCVCMYFIHVVIKVIRTEKSMIEDEEKLLEIK